MPTRTEVSRLSTDARLAIVELARRRGVIAALFSLAAGSPLLSGCSSSGRAAPVAPDRAREAIRTALDSWKRGDQIDTLKSSSPSIVAQDFDWMNGSKLVSYEVLGDGEDDDANLRIPVKLTLRTSQGKEIMKDVSYVVGTSPVLTVFRDFQ